MTESLPKTGRAPDDLPRSASGRVPRWVVEEAVHGRVSDTAWRSSASSCDGPRGVSARVSLYPRPPRRSRSRGAWLGGLLAVAVCVGGLAYGGQLQPGRAGGWQAPADVPIPGQEEAKERLGTPPPAPAGIGGFRFAATQAGTGAAVAYDPCRAVHYVVRQAGAPPGGLAMLVAAFERMSQVSGLRFIYDGPTGEAGGQGRAVYQPRRYPNTWAPVLVVWQTPRENPDFAADVLGQAGSARVSATGHPDVYVTGQVSLDPTKLGPMLASPTRAPAARAVTLHELGHLVGLAHVDDPTQLMFPTASGVLDYADGDLRGLAALGLGACAPWL